MTSAVLSLAKPVATAVSFMCLGCHRVTLGVTTVRSGNGGISRTGGGLTVSPAAPAGLCRRGGVLVQVADQPGDILGDEMADGPLE